MIALDPEKLVLRSETITSSSETIVAKPKGVDNTKTSAKGPPRFAAARTDCGSHMPVRADLQRACAVFSVKICC